MGMGPEGPQGRVQQRPRPQQQQQMVATEQLRGLFERPRTQAHWRLRELAAVVESACQPDSAVAAVVPW